MALESTSSGPSVVLPPPAGVAVFELVGLGLVLALFGLNVMRRTRHSRARQR